MNIQDFVINEVYSNQDITNAFKCSPQGGMRRSHATNTLVLVSDHTGNSIYGDKWIDGRIHYTGMGQTGNQSLNFMQNKTLNESNLNNISVYLFEVFKSTEYTFAGEVKLVAEPYKENEKDKDGNNRIVYRFPLEIISESYLPLKNIIEETEVIKENKVRKNTKDEIAELAKKNSNLNKGKRLSRLVKSKVYERDPYIRDFVKSIANGICQLCEQIAPFEVNGEPYLHVHHIEYLAKGGEDTIENSIAVCPNCHDRIHILKLEEDKAKLIRKVENRSYVSK